ncbi:S-formylglutathione hydrolase [Paraperlucidibaca baekdonensis]|uniref:S-formylglutathione hydrolase n=1 Tax=Paraperlucidibaca baekdonensis TaxID=748120 RepID=A0A3E0H5H7_9GAMM|nr:S-formylglutathione hydrolase [Paraperlucidibaca baekdonensis]REH37702.1 S-formylglutathione hydrolase [Paraperlucidibaca baekdonensis]
MAFLSTSEAFTTRSQHACFGGVQGFYMHDSSAIGLPMRFSVYQPPQAAHGSVPVVFFLAGLTCTDETFMVKAGAQRIAAELGLMLVACDTSPRDIELPGDRDYWDFGVGAGFYLDATEQPWAKHYRMGSYVLELRELVLKHFSAQAEHVGIMGHSMGGHGALTIGLKNPALFQSVSAFAPIAAPSDCPWGEKAFSHYLGDDRSSWRAYDATALVEDGQRTTALLVDQGLDDQFLINQLHPARFEAACLAAGQPLTLRRQSGYDHGYYFISSFIADHLHHHAQLLR